MDRNIVVYGNVVRRMLREPFLADTLTGAARRSLSVTRVTVNVRADSTEHVKVRMLYK